MKNTTCSIIALLLFPALPAAARQPEFVRRQLDQPSVVSDVRCAATGRHSADFFPNGALRSCPLASDTTIATHRLSAGTWITIDSLRRLEAAWLEKNTVLAGHTCKGTGYKGFHVRFRPGNGSLFSCYLARDTIIAGVPCLHGSFWTEVRGGSRSVAVFHPEGSLAGCQASREFTLDGVRYPRWTRIARDTSGAISAVARTSRTSATDRDTQMASRHDCGAWKPALLGAVVGGVGAIALATAWDRNGGASTASDPFGRAVLLIPIGFVGTVVGGFTGALIGTVKQRSECGIARADSSLRSE